MRLCRFDDRLGYVVGDDVFDVTNALTSLPQHGYPFPRTDVLVENLSAIAPHIVAEARMAKSYPQKGLRLLSPIANSGKVLAAPVNYKKHIEEAIADPAIHHQNKVEEIQRVGLFLKATSSVVGPGEGIVIRYPERRTDHEIELAVVVGKRGDKITNEHAMEHVAGYCIGLDITVRGPEERSLRKSIDTYTVLGPHFVTSDEVSNPSALDLHLSVNGETRQKANTRDLILGISDLIVFASSFYTLMPGDVLLTGTPEGVGPIVAGDTLEATISEVGSMKVEVR